MKVLIKYFIKNLFYIIEVFYIFIMNTINKNSFYILTPRIISYFLMRVVIFDKIKKIFFIQYVRNFYDINTVFQIFGYEEYNLKKIKLWNKLINEYKNIKANKLIVDCGSNIGSTSRYFFEIYKNAKIISIEPDESNFKYLSKNVRPDKIKLLNLGVASQEYDYKVIKKKDPRAHKIGILKNRGKKTSKKTITINKILQQEKKKIWPFIIKIDIEGFEKDLFSKNYNWMDQFKIIIVEIHDWMLPYQNISLNYINALSKISKINKRDLIILGENLISIRKK
tara:strand:- start:804 stop:1646 length:843 start_codon:yes stop_codon:yes gene_type:complete